MGKKSKISSSTRHLFFPGKIQKNEKKIFFFEDLKRKSLISFILGSHKEHLVQPFNVFFPDYFLGVRNFSSTLKYEKFSDDNFFFILVKNVLTFRY